MAEAQKFSIGLRLSDLNDFIAPSQACSKPVSAKPSGAADDPSSSDGTGSLQVSADGSSYAEVGADGKRSELAAASVALNDCLACSGCITSAEGVLVAAQSAAEFVGRAAAARESGAIVVVSVSPHSLASLAAFFDLSLITTFRKLVAMFKMLGATYVTDTSFTHDMALEEMADDFVERIKKVEGAGPLPLLASECPGWVCYAEKTQAHSLPHISAAKSAMEVMGALVRSKLLPRPAGKEDADVFHAAVMPCFDKKLEASRDDFASADGKTRDVDTVLATTEVLEVLERAAPGTKFEDIAEAPLDDGTVIWANVDASGRMFGAPHAAAGGYLEHAIRRALADVHGATECGELKFAPAASAAKNADFCEASLVNAPAGAVKSAFAYGFRNIQNVVRRLKQKSCPYQFVEVVACPMACLNGGGQMKPPKGVTREQWAEKVKARFSERTNREPKLNVDAQRLRSDLGRIAMRTQYHFREDKSAKNPLAIQW